MIYIGLAVLMAAGLVLFGIGTGGGGGGLLGGLSGSGGSSNSSGAVTKSVQTAQAHANANPTDADAWAKVIAARWELAQSAGYSNGGFSQLGQQQLRQLTADYERYLKLAPKPEVTTATFAARAYSYLGDYAQQAHTWDVITSTHPSPYGYKCLALSAYAAKNTNLAQLAKAKVLAHVPKKQQAAFGAQLEQASTKPTYAQGC